MKSIEEIVLESIHQLAETDDIAGLKDIDANTPLIGQGGVLDSAAFVFLITEIEEAIEREYGKQLTIVNDSAFGRNSPFRNVGALSEYLATLL